MLLFKDSMDKIGCTTPFGPNKDFVCTNQTLGIKALKLYRNMIYKHHHNCKDPCSYITMRLIKTREQVEPLINKRKASWLKIETQENIKVVEAHYLYSGLSLIAEIGGYVGLFLGVSVIQINGIIKKALKVIFKH